MADSFLEILNKEYLESLGLEGFRLWRVSDFMRHNNIAPTMDEFKKLKREDIVHIRGFGKEKQNKLMWLIDYLNGNVEGKYEKEKACETQAIRELNQRIELKNEKINELGEKIKELQEENKNLKQENKELRKNDRVIEKLKEVLNCS